MHKVLQILRCWIYSHIKTSLVSTEWTYPSASWHSTPPWLALNHTRLPVTLDVKTNKIWRMSITSDWDRKESLGGTMVIRFERRFGVHPTESTWLKSIHSKSVSTVPRPDVPEVFFPSWNQRGEMRSPNHIHRYMSPKLFTTLESCGLANASAGSTQRRKKTVILS